MKSLVTWLGSRKMRCLLTSRKGQTLSHLSLAANLCAPCHSSRYRIPLDCLSASVQIPPWSELKRLHKVLLLTPAKLLERVRSRDVKFADISLIVLDGAL